MEPGDLMSHSQGLSNNPYPEMNQPKSLNGTYFFKIHSISVLPSTLGLPKGLFPSGLTVKIFEAPLPSFILAI